MAPLAAGMATEVEAVSRVGTEALGLAVGAVMEVTAGPKSAR